MSNNDSKRRSSPSVVASNLMEATQTFGQTHPTSLCDVGSNEQASLAKLMSLNGHYTKVKSKHRTIARLAAAMNCSKWFLTLNLNFFLVRLSQPSSFAINHRSRFSHHTLPNNQRNKTKMSEHNSADDEIDVNSSVTHIRDEINFIHAEAYNAREALVQTLSNFTKRFEAIDSRLNRIKRPERYVPETKKLRKDKAVEIKEEEGSNGEGRPVSSKKRQASEPEAAPRKKKKKVKGL